MAPLFTFYGVSYSGNSERVSLTIAETGITDFQFVVIDLRKGEHKSPEHLARHPFGKVPALTTASGFTLFEGRAISKFLASTYKPSLLPPPSDLVATAIFDQALSIEMTYIADPAALMNYEKVIKPMIGMKTDEAKLEELRKMLDGKLDGLEAYLEGKEYMAGDFGLVDIYMIPTLRKVISGGYGEMITGRKNVSAWWARCISRPAIKKCIEEQDGKR